MSNRLLRDVRVLVQHAETIAAAGRRIIKEMEGAEVVGALPNDDRVERAVQTIEKRAVQMCAEIGVQWQEAAQRRGAAVWLPARRRRPRSS